MTQLDNYSLLYT